MSRQAFSLTNSLLHHMMIFALLPFFVTLVSSAVLRPNPMLVVRITPKPITAGTFASYAAPAVPSSDKPISATLNFTSVLNASHPRLVLLADDVPIVPGDLTPIPLGQYLNKTRNFSAALNFTLPNLAPISQPFKPSADPFFTALVIPVAFGDPFCYPKPCCGPCPWLHGTTSFRRGLQCCNL